MPVDEPHAHCSLRDQRPQGGGVRAVRVPPAAAPGGALRQRRTAPLPVPLVRHAVEQGTLLFFTIILTHNLMCNIMFKHFC